MTACLSAPPRSEAVTRVQNTDPSVQKIGSLFPQAVCKLLEEQAPGRLPWDWVTAIMVSAEIDGKYS